MNEFTVTLKSGRTLTAWTDGNDNRYVTRDRSGREIRVYDYDRTVNAEFAWGPAREQTVGISADPDGWDGDDDDFANLGDWYLDNSHLLIDALIRKVEKLVP